MYVAAHVMFIENATHETYHHYGTKNIMTLLLIIHSFVNCTHHNFKLIKKKK